MAPCLFTTRTQQEATMPDGVPTPGLPAISVRSIEAVITNGRLTVIVVDMPLWSAHNITEGAPRRHCVNILNSVREYSYKLTGSFGSIQVDN